VKKKVLYQSYFKKEMFDLLLITHAKVCTIGQSSSLILWFVGGSFHTYVFDGSYEKCIEELDTIELLLRPHAFVYRVDGEKLFNLTNCASILFDDGAIVATYHNPYQEVAIFTGSEGDCLSEYDGLFKMLGGEEPSLKTWSYDHPDIKKDYHRQVGGTAFIYRKT